MPAIPRALPVLAVLALPAAWAQTEDPDTLTFSARQSMRYDSNLFRRANDQRSETQSISTLGVAFDKRYSLQRVELDASVAAHRFRSNDYLNFNAVNYRAEWHWSVTPRLYGSLSRTRDEEINTFDYYRSFDRNVRTEHATRGSAELVVGRDWRLLGSMSREERNNERPTSQLGDYTLRNAAVGVRRLFPSGSSISYRLFDGRGDYQNRIAGLSQAPTRFDQRVHELRVTWPVTGKTTLAARLAHQRRDHPGYAARDYAGTVGNVSVQWAATGKVGVQLVLARELSAYQTETSSYSANNRVSLNPYWNIGARTLLYGSYTLSRQNFGGALPGVPDEQREDRVHGAVIGLRWRPFNALALNAMLARENRNSSLAGFDYTNNAARVDATFSF